MKLRFFEYQHLGVLRRCVAVVAAAASSVLLGACASLPLGRVDAQWQQSLPIALSKQTLWRRDNQADAAAAARAQQLLASAVTQDAAVQLALLANPDLQLQLEQLGMARSAWLEASQIANPVLSFSRRALQGGPGHNSEIAIAQNVLDLLALPGRRRSADAAWEAARFEAVHAVLHLALTVRQQYLRALAAQTVANQAKKREEITQLMFELTQRYALAGNLTISEREQRHDDSVAARALSENAAADAVVQRQRLLRLMGVTEQSTAPLQFSDSVPTVPDSEPTFSALEQAAQQRRVDLAAARKQLDARLLELRSSRRWRALSALELRVSSEQDPDGARVTGPAISLPLSVFNAQNAALAAGDSQARMALRRTEALALDIGTELRGAYAQLQASRHIALAWRDEVLPARATVVDSVQREYGFMLKTPWDLLSAQQNLLAAQIGAAESARDYWIARIAVAEAAGDLSIAEPGNLKEKLP